MSIKWEYSQVMIQTLYNFKKYQTNIELPKEADVEARLGCKVNIKQWYIKDHLQQEKGRYQTKWKRHSDRISHFYVKIFFEFDC